MMRPALAFAAILLLAGCSGSGRRAAVAPRAIDSGFGALAAGWRTDFSRTLVPPGEFQAGGPGKDGIPAITHPRFVRPAEVHFLRAREPVIEFIHDGDARAYPLQILVWHEIVDDRVGGVPVAVTFCPLCNTAIAFDRRVGGKTLEFRVSGNLRNSDLVMYDTATESWWQQFSGRALVGRYAGTNLQQLPARIVSFAASRARIRTGACSHAPGASTGPTATIPTPATTTSPAHPSSRRHTQTITVCLRRSASSWSSGTVTASPSRSRCCNGGRWLRSRSPDGR